MDVEKLFHMTGGVGNTSYAKNSHLQRKASDLVKHITIQTVQDVYDSLKPITSFGVADLGCSSGPNTLSIIKDIFETVEGLSCQEKNNNIPEEFRVYLNDLPTNDFNSIFKTLPDFYKDLYKGRETNIPEGYCPSIFVAGYPGSFYGRLFPNNSLHFIYSSYSLHWLSKVPSGIYNSEQGKSVNKGNVYISKSSPPEVSRAYYAQFLEDFSLFLASRSKEMIRGGRMVLILLGRISEDHVDRGNSFFWELLSRSLANFVSRGLIEKAKLDSYDVHFYAPCKKEIKEEVRKQGSFELDRFETFQIENELDKNGGESYGTNVAMTVRAIQESMLRHHFGGDIPIDDLFKLYGKMVDEEMIKQEIKPVTFLLVLKRL
ncbi:hypothetical protein ACFE04_022543 [Oxalis oulophora]